MRVTAEFLQNGTVVGSRELVVEGHAVTFRKAELPAGLTHVAFRVDAFTGRAGEDGFFVIPSLSHVDTSAMVRFRERPDTEHAFRNHMMPIFAMGRQGRGLLAVLDGMRFEYELVVGVRDGRYYLYPRFILDDGKMFDDITLRFLETGDASYSGLARLYRQYQLERGACLPLKERAKRYPLLAEAALGPEVRVRLCWKPSPNGVLEQTPENEPPLHVALTFDRCGEVLDEFRRQGIDKAEFCLVGWNRSGHDGAFPDLFPVEPKLGGEEALLRLTRKARELGYLMTAHTLPVFGFSLARRYHPDNLLRNRDGSDNHNGYHQGLSGGMPRYLCPKAGYEQYVVQDFKDIAHLGFRGIFYEDVMSIERPLSCYNPLHPLSSTEAGQWRSRSLALARETIGGSSSEGAWDFCVQDLDYVLYTHFNLDKPLPPICDRVIPFWHIVYHGILLYNTCCATVNQALKADRSLPLLNLEFGGRPAMYFYSRFKKTGSNWMGEEDLTCDTDEQLRQGVARIKADYDEYRKVRDLQFEFLEEHELLAEKVARTRYANGTVLAINRSPEPYTWEGEVVPPLSYVRRDPSSAAPG